MKRKILYLLLGAFLLVLAGCTVITLPLVIVFLIFQDQFMSSVTIGAVKE